MRSSELEQLPASLQRRHLQRELTVSDNPVATCRDLVQRVRLHCDQMFAANVSMLQVLRRRCWLVDRLLEYAWQRVGAPAGMALVATGGYGRGVLHPHSDVDLLILHAPQAHVRARAAIEQLVAFLWDIQLHVAHRVYSVRSAARAARSDLHTLTSLLEARLLCGEPALLQALQGVTAPQRMWPPQRFFRAKCQEQEERHRRFHHTADNLEPDVKEGPGGLRDIHTIGWVAMRYLGTYRLHELHARGFLKSEEYRSLVAARELLWRIRYALHLQSERQQECLHFERQREVARLFGYSQGGNAGVEQFMKSYYRNAHLVNLLNEVLLQHVREHLPRTARSHRVRPLNQRFHVLAGHLQTAHDNVFRHAPHTLLEPFLLLQQHPRLRGIGSATLRRMRSQLHRMDDACRRDARSRGLFLEILRQPHGVAEALRRMHRSGVLGAFLPVFQRIEGMMQFDLFHAYTVDEHTLQVLSNVDALIHGGDARYPLSPELARQLPKRELLYLAALFHDIAKGRGTDHSVAGAEEALTFCRHLGFGDYDANLVAWLVAKHLLMSRTAQREDLDDAETIRRFALQVGDVDRLNYLYLLTMADISGTHPKLWNSWKHNLLATCHTATLRLLRRGLSLPDDRQQRIAEARRQALAMLGSKAERRQRAQRLWACFGEDYFIRYRADEIAWHGRALLRYRETDGPLVLVKPRTSRHCTEVFVYMRDRDHIFATTARCLDDLQLSVVDARIITADNGYTLDSYSVLELDGKCVRGTARVQQITTELGAKLGALDGTERLKPRAPRRQADRTQHFSVPTRVEFFVDQAQGRTVMELVTADRPGLLWQVGDALGLCRARLQGAKIATYGERVEDLFFLTGDDHRAIDDAVQLECLRVTLTRALGPGR